MVAYMICLNVSLGLISLVLCLQHKRINVLEDKVKELKKKHD